MPLYTKVSSGMLNTEFLQIDLYSQVFSDQVRT